MWNEAGALLLDYFNEMVRNDRTNAPRLLSPGKGEEEIPPEEVLMTSRMWKSFIKLNLTSSRSRQAPDDAAFVLVSMREGKLGFYCDVENWVVRGRAESFRSCLCDVIESWREFFGTQFAKCVMCGRYSGFSWKWFSLTCSKNGSDRKFREGFEKKKSRRRLGSERWVFQLRKLFSGERIWRVKGHDSVCVRRFRQWPEAVFKIANLSRWRSRWPKTLNIHTDWTVLYYLMR